MKEHTEKHHNDTDRGTHTSAMSTVSAHAGMPAHAGAMTHGSAQDFLRRFWIVTFLLTPLVLVHPAV